MRTLVRTCAHNTRAVSTRARTPTHEHTSAYTHARTHAQMRTRAHIQHAHAHATSDMLLSYVQCVPYVMLMCVALCAFVMNTRATNIRHLNENSSTRKSCILHPYLLPRCMQRPRNNTTSVAKPQAVVRALRQEEGQIVRESFVSYMQESMQPNGHGADGRDERGSRKPAAEEPSPP